jgi:hypothetical protein
MKEQAARTGDLPRSPSYSDAATRGSTELRLLRWRRVRGATTRPIGAGSRASRPAERAEGITDGRGHS